MTPRLATFTVFAINGAMMGTWVAHIPWLQDHLGLSKTTLGLCLLCIAAGALVSMPLTGHILDGRASASVTRARRSSASPRPPSGASEMISTGSARPPASGSNAASATAGAARVSLMVASPLTA